MDPNRIGGSGIIGGVIRSFSKGLGNLCGKFGKNRIVQNQSNTTSSVNNKLSSTQSNIVGTPSMKDRNVNTSNKKIFNNSAGSIGETQPSPPLPEGDLKWKTSLTRDFSFKESSHGVRFASVVTRMISKPLDAIGHVLGIITKSGDNLIGQSRVAELRKINESLVINSQTEVNLENIYSHDRNKIDELSFAASFAAYTSTSGTIYASDNDIPKYKSGELAGKKREGMFVLDPKGNNGNTLPDNIKENVNTFMGQLKDGGFKLCDDGFIRQKGDSNAFQAKLGYDETTKKIFLNFSGTEIGNKRSGTVGSDIAQQFGFTDSLYKQAILLADMAKQCFGDKDLMITGQSLGGGMAQLAAAVTGLEAIVVNPAPINKTIWARTGLGREGLEEANKKIYQLSVKNEILSDKLFSNSPRSMTAQIGQKITVDFTKKQNRVNTVMSHGGWVAETCLRNNIGMLESNVSTGNK
jgi:hypothetical protein